MRRVQQLGPYSLLYRIASGGMAEIYRARKWTLNGELDVAIKRLLPSYNSDEEFITMLTDEAQITRLFNHPNIARMLEFGVYRQQYFFAMEFIDGRDLRTTLRRVNQRMESFGVDAAVFVLEQALRGLHAAHDQRDEEGRRQNIIHRDFTPSNIQLGYDGSVKLIDFGIAKARLSRSRTRAGFIKGKVKYMSPEQTRSEVLDRRSDVFSSGVVLYAALTGRLPFEGRDDDELIEAVREKAPTPPSFLCPELDEAFDQIMCRAMAKEADDRFETAEEFAHALLLWSSRRPPFGPKELGERLGQLFAQERLDTQRLSASFVPDDDPTPTSDRQTYTRLVGMNDPQPRTLTGFEAAGEEPQGTGSYTAMTGSGFGSSSGSGTDGD